MATTQQKATPQATGDGVDFAETLKQSYKAGMSFSERIGTTMLSLPLDVAEVLGLPSDKTQGLRDFNDKFVGGLYRGIDGAIGKITGAVMAPASRLEAGLNKAMAKHSQSEAPVEAATRPKTVARKASSAKKKGSKQAQAADRSPTEEIAG